MIASRLRAEPCATPRYCCWRGVSGVSSASPVMLMMAFIGVRISWLITARNALLARFAASAASLASAISFCAVASAASPESSARATSLNSPAPSERPVRADRSPAFIRRAVCSRDRVSRRKNRSAATSVRPRQTSPPTNRMPRFRRSEDIAARSAVAVGMPIDRKASARPVPLSTRVKA